MRWPCANGWENLCSGCSLMAMAFFSAPGPLELIVILVIALIVLGPKKLPEAARSVGKGMRELRDSIQGEPDPYDDYDPEPDPEDESTTATKSAS
jgi:sec-independent protein translocase protein TatA